MSNFLTLSQVSGGLTGTAPRIFTASTNDTFAEITTAGYVLDKVTNGDMNAFDIVRINYDVDGTESFGWFRVTATSGGSLVVDVGAGAGAGAGARTAIGIKSGITAATTGAGPTALTAAGVVAGDVVTATILASTNVAAVAKAVAGTGTITFTFTVDPGAATTVQWHAITP